MAADENVAVTVTATERYRTDYQGEEVEISMEVFDFGDSPPEEISLIVSGYAQYIPLDALPALYAVSKSAFESVNSRWPYRGFPGEADNRYFVLPGSNPDEGGTFQKITFGALKDWWVDVEKVPCWLWGDDVVLEGDLNAFLLENIHRLHDFFDEQSEFDEALGEATKQVFDIVREFEQSLLEHGKEKIGADSIKDRFWEYLKDVAGR